MFFKEEISIEKLLMAQQKDALLRCVNSSNILTWHELRLVTRWVRNYAFLFSTFVIYSHRFFHYSGIFSESTINGLRYYSETPECEQTASFLELILKMWKIVNVKSLSKGECWKSSLAML